MNCPDCGKKADGNYCSHCGAKLKRESLEALTRHEDITADQRCRKIIEREAGKAKTGMTAPEFWQYAEVLMPRRLPLAALATLSSKIGEKLDAGRENHGFGLFRFSFGHVVLAVLTSLARQSLAVRQVQEGEERCLIEAEIPSTLLNLRGKLEIIIVTESAKTKVFIESKIFGQWMDWGKSRRLIDQLLRDVDRLAAEFQQNKDLN